MNELATDSRYITTLREAVAGSMLIAGTLVIHAWA
jgi:hypothetical protein